MYDRYLRFDVMHMNTLCVEVEIDRVGKKLNLVDHTTIRYYNPFRMPDLKIEHVIKYISNRSFPETRANKDELLELLGLEYYDPIDITSSKGNQVKYTDGNLWFKEDLLGYEGLSEIVASKILSISTLGEQEYVAYYRGTLKLTNGEILKGCVSESFIREVITEHITFQDELDKIGPSYGDFTRNRTTEEKINSILGIMKNETGLDLTDYLRKVITLDTIIFNEDRHLNNLSVLYNIEKNIYQQAPIFDNGLSLLSDLTNYPIQIPTKDLVGIVKSKPFSTNFKKQYEVLGKGFTVPKKELEELLGKIGINLRIKNIIEHSIKRYPEIFEESGIKTF